MTTDQPRYLSPQDQASFLKLCDCVEDHAEGPVTNFKALAARAGIGYTTSLALLDRVAQSIDPAVGKHDITDFFAQPSQFTPRSALELTSLSKHLRDCFRVQLELQEKTIQEAKRRRNNQHPEPDLTVGTTHSLNSRWFSACLSKFPSLFPGVRYTQQTDKTLLLLNRLSHGLLDLVFSFEGPHHPRTAGYGNLTFHAFEFPAKMVLVCHPDTYLCLQDGTDANKGYWKESYELTDPQREWRKEEVKQPTEFCRSKIPHQRCPANLRSISLNEIDMRRVPLIFIPTWTNPLPLVTLSHLAREDGVLIEVNSWEDGLGYVRRGQGVMVADALFQHRERITVFDIQEDANQPLTRQLGCYLRSGQVLRTEAKRLLVFLHAYFSSVAKSPDVPHSAPSLGDPGYEQLCADFLAQKDSERWNWKAISEKIAVSLRS